MLTDVAMLNLSILAWSSLVAALLKIRLGSAIALVVVMSVLTVSLPYYIKVGYLGPFEWLGLIQDTVLAFPLTLFVVMGNRYLIEKWLVKRYSPRFILVVHVGLFGVFAFLPIWDYWILLNG